MSRPMEHGTRAQRHSESEEVFRRVLAAVVRELPADAGAAFSTRNSLLLYADQALEIFYAPVDAVNTRR